MPMQHHKVTYNRLWRDCKLNEHLHEIDEMAHEQMDILVEAMAKADGTDEELKMSDQMEWVGRMNNYRVRAEEVVFRDLIFI